MNHYKPPKRQFAEGAPEISERQVNNKCGNAGVKNRPKQRSIY